MATSKARGFVYTEELQAAPRPSEPLSEKLLVYVYKDKRIIKRNTQISTDS